MGFKPAAASIPESMLSMVDEAIRKGRELASPKGCYEFFTLNSIAPDRVEVVGQFSIKSSKVFDWMAGCDGLYITAVTLGSELDRTVAEMMASAEVTLGYLVNAYGAEAAEAAMVEMNRMISNEANEKGLATTKRYSPGYGDWDISDQKEVLKAVDADQIGISLTDNFLMIPEKSVSAIIGVKPKR